MHHFKSHKNTKYPEPIHGNRHFHGQKAHFDVRIHENAPFYGQSTHFSVPIHENSHFYGQRKAVSKIGIFRWVWNIS